jgi:uncharacterized membrane protein
LRRNSNKKKKKRKNTHSSLPSRQEQNSNSVIASGVPGTPSPRVVAHHQTITTFSGPLPPPEILAKYNEVAPNGADRILSMAEGQSAHRQRLETWSVIGGTILSYVGVFCALIIGLSVLYFSYLIIHEGHVIPGSLMGSGGIAALVGAFIYGTRSRKQERIEKNKRNMDLIGR